MGNNAVLQIMMPFNKYFAVKALRNDRSLKKTQTTTKHNYSKIGQAFLQPGGQLYSQN